MSPVKNREREGGAVEGSQVPRAWEELRLPSSGGVWERETQGEQFPLCPVFPTDSSQREPLPRPVLLSANPGATREFLSFSDSQPPPFRTPLSRRPDSASLRTE